MRGKKPKERQRYVLRVNETLVEVTRDVYLAWYQSRRKERYQLEKMQKNGVCGIEKVGETSYNSYLHILSPEEIVIRVSEIQELQEALKYLSEEEMELIRLLFFEEYTVKKTAQYLSELNALLNMDEKGNETIMADEDIGREGSSTDSRDAVEEKELPETADRIHKPSILERLKQEKAQQNTAEQPPVQKTAKKKHEQEL